MEGVIKLLMNPNEFGGFYPFQFPYNPALSQSQIIPFSYPSEFGPPSMMTPQVNTLQETVNQVVQKLPEQISYKGKRRSKNDNEGRNFKCNHCNRTYLSYPALYTHNKTKHNYLQQPSVPNRGRGRPKKNASKVIQQDPTSPLYFRTEDKQGGPTMVIYGFEEAFNAFSNQEPMKYKEYQSHPLYIELYKLHSNNAKTLDYNIEHPQVKEIGGLSAGFEAVLINQPQIENAPNLEIAALPNPTNSVPAPINQEEVVNVEVNVKEAKEKKCDEIFAEYLNYVAKNVNKKVYKEMVYFVLLFRECFSANGFKLAQSKSILPDVINETKLDLETDFCLVANASYAPEISNEFITQYLDRKRPNLGTLNSIEAIQNLCHWLFMSKYTCTRITLIQEN